MTSFMDFMIAVPEFPVQESSVPIPLFIFSFHFLFAGNMKARQPAVFPRADPASSDQRLIKRRPSSKRALPPPTSQLQGSCL